MERSKPYFDEDGEAFCPKCKKTPGDFIPICNYHGRNPEQDMNCEDCLICDECSPRDYWDEVLK